MKRLFVHRAVYLLYCHRLVIGLLVLVSLLLAYSGELWPQPLFAQNGPTKLTAPVAPVGSAQRLQPGQVPSGLTATSWASIQSQIQQSFHVNNASSEQAIALSQQAYAKASNTEAGDQFGWRVAVAGDTVVIGALTEDSNAAGSGGNQTDNSLQNAGAVYVFVRNGTSWSQQAYLKASNPDANDNFGQAVAISGETIVVGAQAEASSATGVGGNQSNNAAAAAGAVYVFVRNGTSWSQQAYLKASNTEANDQFGEAVAIDGDTIVVGARTEDSNATGIGGNQGNNAATDAGAAYVFVRSGTSWSQQAYLKASNTEAGDQFGNAVAIAGDTVVIGALTEDSSAAGPGGNQGNNAATNAGAVYVFVRNGANWSQQAYLKASNPGANDNFGQAVAIAGETIVVGAQAEASNATGVGGIQSDNSAAAAGAAYVFIRNGASWSQQAYLKASNTEAGDQFGWSVAIAGETIVVGALTEDSNATGIGGSQVTNAASNAGAAYLFVRSGTSWSQQEYMKASNTGVDDQFGVAVAVANETVVVGTRKEDSNATGVDGTNNDAATDAGAAYFFHMPNNFGVTVTNVMVNGSSQSATVKPNEIFTVTLDYHVYDANCPACIKQIVFGYSNESKPQVCVYSGVPGAAGVTGSATFTMTAPATPGLYTIGSDNPAQSSCNDALGGWWSGPPDASRTVATVEAKTYVGVTFYVNDDASGANNGSSWNDAYVYLQDALAAAQSGDEIWVAAGIYYPDEGGSATDNDRTATFQLKNGVRLYGGFSGSETAFNQRNFFINTTILSGDIDQNDSNSDGNQVAETWNDLQGSNAYHVVTGSNTDGAATLNGFTITAGQTVADAPSNSCSDHLCGGGLFVNNGSPNLAFLVLSGNQAKHGGGISLGSNSSPTLLNVIFRGNRATAFGGGLVLSFSSNPTLINAVFSGNRADASGSGLSIGDSNPLLTNVTFSGNQGEAIRVSSANATLTNVIVWGNDPPQIDYNAGTATIRNSLIQGSGGSGSGWNAGFGTDGGGNLDANPLFTDANGADNRFGTPDDNLRLLAGSPAINRGDNSANNEVVDLDFHDRIQNGTIDLGAYEGGVCPSGPLLYVNGAATGVASGQSWPEAFPSLQDALAVSAACANVTEIWVAKGVYYPDVGGGQTNDDRAATFQLRNNLAIYGGFAGTESTHDQRDPAANITILSGDIDQNDSNSDGNQVAETWNDLQGSNAYHVVTGSGVDSSAALNGFIITAGQTVADAPSNSCSDHLCGGGLFVNNGSPSLAFLFLSGNQARHGGGMALGYNSSPTLLNVIFRGNRATAFGGGLDLSFSSNPTLTNTTFSGNRADAGGGGMSIVNSNPLLTNVTFVDNQAGAEAAGLLSALSNPVATNVTFSGNLAPRAGAIVQQSGGLTLKNSTFSGNQAGADGAILSQNGVITITNSILANSVGGANCSGTIVSGDYNLSSDASCGLDKPHDRANTAPQLAALADNGGATQTHALQTGSPAIDKGNCSDNTVMVDQRGVTRPQGPACDIGAYEVTGASAYDFGDAPDPTYPTLLASNGARHGLVSNRHLGATVDSEADGQPTANADGDDSNGDDDDGVVLPAALNICTLANLNVTAAAAGLLNGWIDFNADGDWGDAGEQILRGLALNAGAQALSFQVPCDAALDKQVAARFRFGGTAILGPSGAAFDGEVEDYLVALQRGNPLAQADQAETNEDRPVLIDVLANDLDPVGGPLTLVAVTAPARGSAVIESGRVRYTPHVDFAGVDTFAYTLQNEVGKQVKAQVNIRVRAINDAPTNLELSNNSLTIPLPNYFFKFLHQMFPSVVIGRLSTSDPDPGDTHTYKIAPDSQGPFAVVNGVLQTLQPIEVASSSFVQYTVVIISTDEAGAAIERSFTVTIFGPSAPDGPVGMTLSKDQIGENQPANAVVGILSTADAKSGVHTYSLVAGTGSDNNNNFVINGNQLLAKAPLDYEAKELHSIRVRTVNDKGASMEQPFVIKVIDDNGEPGEPTPQNCATATIKFIDTASALVEVTNVAAASQTANGCTIQGTLHVRIPGSEVAGIAFTGRVDAKNQLYSDTRLQALNQQVTSSEAQTSAGIGAFKLTVAGLTLEVNKATVEYYLGRPSIRLAGAKWCLPAAWGGLCSPLASSDILIDASGLRLGGSAGFSLPEILLGKAASRLPGPRLIGLKATLNPVAGGYEITAAGQFGIPKLPMKIGGASDCGLTASLTIYVDAATGATVLALDASAAGLQSDGAIAGVALRQVSIGMECDKGIPLGMGLQLTGIRGTLSLRAGDQYISLGVTIETIAKAGPFTLAKLDGDATVLWDPEWGFDLVATLKLLGFLEAARSEMNIRENRFHFDGYIRGGITSGHVRLDAWTRNGSFYMTGSGKYALGIAKGAVYSGRSGLVMAAETGETAGGWPDWDDVKGVAKEVAGTVVGVGSAVIDKGSEVVGAVANAIQRVISIDLPPIDLTVGSVNGDFGRFTNNNWGIKGYIKVGDVVGDIARDLLNFFHVPNEFGVFIDSSGHLDFGSVTEYTLVTPPPILAARQRWQMAQAGQGATAAATDGQFSFVSANEVIIATPLTLAQPGVRAATVISQVRVSAPATVNFMLTSYEPLTMTLLAPDGTHITPANYNQPPMNQKYQIDYGVRTIYEAVERTAIPNTDARLRFMPASNLPQFAAVDVLVDGVPVWQNVKPFNPAARDPNYDSNYLAIEPGLHTLSLVPTGQSTIIVSTTLDAQFGVGYTIATAGAGTPQIRLLSDEQATPPSFGQAYARFVHLGDADRKVTVLINGVPAFSNLNYRDASAYQLLPAGDVTIEVVDATTNAVIAPQRILPLQDTSLVFTFFLFDYNADAFTLDYIGAIDDLYLPRLYTIYAVGGADMGDWKVDLAGDLAGVNYALSVNAFAAPTQLSNVTVNAGNLSQTQVNWTLKSEFAPTLVTLYANPGELTGPLSYTNTNGISVTEQITNFTGFPVKQVTLSDPNQLNNAVGGLLANLTELESGTYRLWLQVDDGVNPPRVLYARDPSTGQIAVITVNNTNFPQTWTPTITPTIDVDNALLGVQWTGLTHPDIDSYTLHLGTTPGASERTDSGLAPIYAQDAAGQAVGLPTVSGLFSNIEPGRTYYLYIEAIDAESGRLVRSPIFSVAISQGAFALTASSTHYLVARGSTIKAPLALEVTTPLFDPNVALAIYDEGLPRGIWAQFEHDLVGETSLQDDSSGLAVSAAGANPVIVHRASVLAAVQTATLVITVTETVTDGLYPLTVIGYNGVDGEQRLTIYLQVGAVGFQAQTMCYGPDLDLRIPFSTAAVQAGIDLVVITGPLPPNLMLNGAATCIPYTSLRSMVELTNQLVTQGCANNAACNPVERIVFDYDGSYRIETIQTVEVVRDLFLPLVSNDCIGSLACN